MCKFLQKLFFFIVIFLVLTPQTFAASPASVPILMYHYIRDNVDPKDKTGIDLSVPAALFDQEMQYLATNGYTPLTLDEVWANFNGIGTLPEKPVVITFDDGTKDLYSTAYPILQKYNLKATSFIITGFVDRPGFVTWDQILEMYHSGTIDIQSHTINHIYMTQYGYEALMYELLGSKKTLEGKLGKPVNFLAYPIGATNEYVQTLTKNAGYLGAVGTWYGPAAGISMDMPRIRVHGQESLQDFTQSLQPTQFSFPLLNTQE
jgi:peptidoglycan/xylan/chitin deacetylase (PgdA/CDA1 family)